MTADLDAQTVRILGRGMGFGRLMQLTEREWRHDLGLDAGAEHTVGPCAALLVPCLCAGDDRLQPCGWCGGTRRVTERVRMAFDAAVTALVGYPEAVFDEIITKARP